MSAGADTQRQKGEGEGPGSGVWSGKAPGVEGGTRMKTKEMRGGAVQGSERTPRGVGPGGEPPRDGVVGVVDLRFRMPGSLGETGGESPPDRDRIGDSPAWSGRGSLPSRRTSG